MPPCQDTTRPAQFLTVSAGEMIMIDSGYLERKKCAHYTFLHQVHKKRTGNAEHVRGVLRRQFLMIPNDGDRLSGFHVEGDLGQQRADRGRKRHRFSALSGQCRSAGLG